MHRNIEEEEHAIQVRWSLAQTQDERFAIGLEYIDFGWQVMVDGIKQAQPDISKANLIATILKRCYRSEFTDEQIADITANIR